tara:strand:+ start:1706 stop:4729 length:3024 start_codon:yes stop_codon:yes gene_type:complete
MNKEILYLLLLGSLVFLKTKQFKNTMVLWAIFISSFYLLFMNKESYVNRKEGDESRTKLYVNGDEIIGNSIGNKDTPLSRFSLDLRVPETIAFEVLTTDDCRQKCEQPSFTWTNSATENINKVLTGSADGKILLDRVGTDSSGGNYGNAARITMSNFLLSQDINSGESISTLNPSFGSLGASLEIYDNPPTQFLATSNADAVGCSACQYGTLEGNPANTTDIPDNLGSEGCPAACIWNAWNKCGQLQQDELADNSRKQACARFDTDQATGIGPDRLGSETSTWDWGTNMANNSDTNSDTKPLASPEQTPSSIRNISNSVFKPIITSVTRKSPGTDTTPLSDWSSIIISDGSPSYYSCINRPEVIDAGTNATGRGSCQTSQTFTWFTDDTLMNTDESSFTNLKRQGQYGELSFNYSLNIGDCPPSASGGVYEIEFELPKSLFCNRDETETCEDNKFTVYIQCQHQDAPESEPIPEPDPIPEPEPSPCGDYPDITSYCETKNKIYREIGDTYTNNEPDSCCIQPDSCSNFDDLNGKSLKDYCKTTFSKYSLPEPENILIVQSDPQPEDIEGTCCGKSIITCFEPEELIERDALPAVYTSIEEYCRDEPRYSEINSEAEPFEEDDYSNITEKCCDDKGCELYMPQIFYIIIPVVISIFIFSKNKLETDRRNCYFRSSTFTFGMLLLTAVLLNTTIFPTLLKQIKSFIYSTNDIEDKNSLWYTVVLVVIALLIPASRLYFELYYKAGGNISELKVNSEWSFYVMLSISFMGMAIAFLVIFNETFIDSIYSNLDLFRLNARWGTRKSYKSNYFTDRFSPYIPGPEKTCGDNYNDYTWDWEAIIRDTVSEPQSENLENYYVNGKNNKENDNSVYDCNKSHCGTETRPPGYSENRSAVRNKVVYCLFAAAATYWFIKSIYCYDARLRNFNLNRLATRTNSTQLSDTLTDPNFIIMSLMILLVITMIGINIWDHSNMKNDIKFTRYFYMGYIILLLVNHYLTFSDINSGNFFKFI